MKKRLFLYSTVISYNKDALDAIARYAPSLDMVGFASTANIPVRISGK